MIKIAIVTGVASGIGEYVAENFIKSGIEVYGIDIKPTKVKNIHFYNCDISDETQIKSTMSLISQNTSRVDYLVNVAGIFCDKERSKIEDLKLEEWLKVVNVNLTGTFLMTKYTIPFLKNSNDGCIINISSDQTSLLQEKSAPYAVSKAGVEMFSNILALELLDQNIRVNAIALSSVRTNFILNYKKDKMLVEKLMNEMDQSMPFGIIGPQDVYGAIEFLIKNNKITGQKILIDSGLTLSKYKKRG